MRTPTLLTTAVVGVALLAGCGSDDQSASNGGAKTTDAAAKPQRSAGSQQATGGSERQARTVAIGDLVGNPAKFEGEYVRVKGDVEGATSTPSAFGLTPAQGTSAIVVLPAASATNASGVVTDQRLTVVGRVVRKDDTLTERYDLQFEDQKNPGELYNDIDGKYVLVGLELQTEA